MAHQFFNPFPKYLQIREILLRRIERDFKLGEQFPTEKELCAEFGVSRETVREALGWLVRKGLISRHRGQGTFVTKRLDRVVDNRLTGLTEHFSELKLDTEAKVLEKGPIDPPADIVAAIGVPPDEAIYHIVRLRTFEKRPLAVHESFMPLEYGVQVAKLDLRHTSIVHELEHTLGIAFWEDHQQIEAVVADTGMAILLDVPLGAPLLLMTRLYLTEGNRAVVLFRSHYRADRYFYTVKLDQRRNQAVRRRAGHAQAKARGVKVGGKGTARRGRAGAAKRSGRRTS